MTPLKICLSASMRPNFGFGVRSSLHTAGKSLPYWTQFATHCSATGLLRNEERGQRAKEGG